MRVFENPSQVVMSAPAKKLSDWFISSDKSFNYGENVWCFDQYSAINALIELQIQQSASEFILEPIKI